MQNLSKLVIEVPERFSDNFGDPFRYILQILPDLNLHWDEIVVDFRNSKFIVPHYLGPLSCILKKKSNEGVKITILDSHTGSYLNTVQFPFGLDLNHGHSDELKFKFKSYSSKTYLPIVHFPTGAIRQEADTRINVLSAIDALLKEQLKLPINVLQAFYYFLEELTQNVVDHSGVNSGMVFAQFYPDKNYLDLSICDAGKGIYHSYLTNSKHRPQSNTEALNFAVYGKSTKDIPESRGFGLNTSRSMLVKGMQGKFLLMSGNDFFVQTINREEIISLDVKDYFPGCMLNLRIPIFRSESFTIHSYTNL